MTYNHEIHHRRSIRLRDFDYNRPGAYFVTVCVQDRECLFGHVAESEMVLNEAGMMVQAIWEGLPAHYPGVEIDAGIIMPNHFHGIIVLNVGAALRGRLDNDVGAAPCGRRGQAQVPAPTSSQPRHPQGGAPTLSLPDLVHRIKSLTTARYRHGVERNGWPSFPGRLWQRNYFEHIIRDETNLHAIRQYIAGNPAKWEEDENHPSKL